MKQQDIDAKNSAEYAAYKLFDNDKEFKKALNKVIKKLNKRGENGRRNKL